MKRYITILCFAAVAASCAKENTVVPEENMREMEISVSSTKNSFRRGDAAILWTPGDRLSVFDGKGNREFVARKGGESVTFSGLVDKDAREFTAVYPYNAESFLGKDGAVCAVLKSRQHAFAGGFTDESNLSVGHGSGENPHIVLKNVGSYLHFTIAKGNEDITSVVISSNGGEPLSGMLRLSEGESGFSVEGVSGVPSVVLIPDSGVISPGTYYLVVAPGTYSKGLSISFTRSSDLKVATKSGSSSNMLKSNEDHNLGTFDPKTMLWADDTRFKTTSFILNFSTMWPFWEKAPSEKTILSEDLISKTGGYRFHIRSSDGNTRGAGWYYKSGVWSLFFSKYHIDGDVNFDGIMLPAIPGKKLKSVSLSFERSIFQMVVCNADGEIVPGGEDENTENWTISVSPFVFNLSGTEVDTNYYLAARGKNGFNYLTRISLTYETEYVCADVTSVTTSAATEISDKDSTAKLNGSFTSSAAGVTYGFEYREAGGEWNTITVGSGGKTSFSHILQLERRPADYEYRSWANGGPSSRFRQYGSVKTFSMAVSGNSASIEKMGDEVEYQLDL